MKVARILIQSEKIIVKFDHIDDNEKLSFVLRNRKTKDLIGMDGIQDNAKDELTLYYSEVDLPEVEFARYDLLILTKEKLIRPKIENQRLSLKKINADVFYFTNEKYGFRFYFTRDNEVSVGRGNYINVEKEFKQVKSIDIPITEIEYTDTVLSLKTPFVSPSKTNFIAWKDKKENYILHPNTSFHAEGNRSSIDIEKTVFPSIISLNKITPIIVFVQDSVFYEGTLTTDLGASDRQIGNELGIYTYSDSGNLKITPNLNLYMRKVLGVEKEKCYVDEYSFTADTVTIELMEKIDPSKVLLFKEDIANRYFIQVKDFQIDGTELKIPAEKIVSGQERCRYVFLKRYNKALVPESSDLLDENLSEKGISYSGYQYFGFYKENFEQKSLKSDIYSDPVVVGENLLLCSYWSSNGDLIFKAVTPDEYRAKRYEDRNINFSGSVFRESPGQMEIQLESIDLNTVNKLNFYLLARKTKQKFNIEYSVENSKTVILDFRAFLAQLELESSRWDMFVEVYQQESYLHGKLGMFSSSVQDKFERYLSPINEQENESNFCLVPYFSVKNELALIWNDIDKIHNEQLEHDIRVISSKVSSSTIEIVAEVSKVGVPEFKVAPGIIKLRNKALIKEYEVPTEVISQSKDKAKVRLKITPEEFHLLPFYWDIYVVLQVGENDFPLRLKNPSKGLKRSISKKISKNEIDLKGGYMIYPYITIDNSYALCYRDRQTYENRINRLKENLAYVIYHVFRKYFDRKKIWIGYEKEASVAQDNGYQFFNYCYTNNKKKNFYFVIKTDAADYQDIKHQKDKILKFMSLKYMVYMFAAELLVSSESKGHSYDIRIQKGRLRNVLKKKPFVFLQHGVIALKRVDYVFNKRRNKEISLFTVSSDFEKDIIHNNFGFDLSEIMLTGLTRWDVLEDKSTEEDKKIFVMPTWRSWMDGIPEEEFIASNYFKQYKELLESKELNDILEKNNLTLHFLLHPKFSEYSDKFGIQSDRIKTYRFGDVKINEMLMESSLLITDYSSVSFEFFYMKKPVLFFQFDRDEYERYQGSYMDFEKDLFGDSASNVNDLLTNLKYYVDNNFQENPEYAVLRNKFFKYVDHNNSKRTFNAVRKYEKTLK
ncbi:CDP-glycerol glycerophosphotransferase family protein [Ligilactobacillus acidipiscis]|nr:CDP-glycerol glycerophosphotransferase family protein [Ligilactobacillus acidipiscis]